MAACNYGCEEMPEHLLNQCNKWLYGGSDSVAFLECDHSIIDFSDVTEWDTAITANKVHFAKQVKADYPDASPVEGENPVGGDTENVLDGLDHILNIFDFNVQNANDTFYETANTRKFHIVWREKSNGKIRVVEIPSNVVGLPANLAQQKSEKSRYNVQVKWRSNPDVFPTYYDTPGTLFDV